MMVNLIINRVIHDLAVKGFILDFNKVGTVSVVLKSTELFGDQGSNIT